MAYTCTGSWIVWHLCLWYHFHSRKILVNCHQRCWAWCSSAPGRGKSERHQSSGRICQMDVPSSPNFHFCRRRQLWGRVSSLCTWEKGPYQFENRRILWYSATVTLLPIPTSVPDSEVLCIEVLTNKTASDVDLPPGTKPRMAHHSIAHFQNRIPDINRGEGGSIWFLEIVHEAVRVGLDEVPDLQVVGVLVRKPEFGVRDLGVVGICVPHLYPERVVPGMCQSISVTFNAEQVGTVISGILPVKPVQSNKELLGHLSKTSFIIIKSFIGEKLLRKINLEQKFGTYKLECHCQSWQEVSS